VPSNTAFCTTPLRNVGALAMSAVIVPFAKAVWTNMAPMGCSGSQSGAGAKPSGAPTSMHAGFGAKKSNRLPVVDCPMTVVDRPIATVVLQSNLFLRNIGLSPLHVLHATKYMGRREPIRQATCPLESPLAPWRHAFYALGQEPADRAEARKANSRAAGARLPDQGRTLRSAHRPAPTDAVGRKKSAPR
jgi:hypothetical protein